MGRMNKTIIELGSYNIEWDGMQFKLHIRINKMGDVKAVGKTGKEIILKNDKYEVEYYPTLRLAVKRIAKNEIGEMIDNMNISSKNELDRLKEVSGKIDILNDKIDSFTGILNTWAHTLGKDK